MTYELLNVVFHEKKKHTQRHVNILPTSSRSPFSSGYFRRILCILRQPLRRARVRPFPSHRSNRCSQGPPRLTPTGRFPLHVKFRAAEGHLTRKRMPTWPCRILAGYLLDDQAAYPMPCAVPANANFTSTPSDNSIIQAAAN